jgi:hypothetical protein
MSLRSLSTALAKETVHFLAASLLPDASLLSAFLAAGSILSSLRFITISLTLKLGRFNRLIRRFMNVGKIPIMNPPTCYFKIGSFSLRPVFIISFVLSKAGAVWNFSILKLTTAPPDTA